MAFSAYFGINRGYSAIVLQYNSWQYTITQRVCLSGESRLFYMCRLRFLASYVRHDTQKLYNISP